MFKLTNPLLCSFVLAALGFTAAAVATENAVLHPQAERISDSVINADQQAYQLVQQRIQALNETGQRPVLDYHLSKAQCWLDVSFHEYNRNDRSDFTQLALDESVKLVRGMEQGQQLGHDTPLVNNAARLRPDLWQKFAVLKQHQGFACAQQLIACAEVELVHAGNEYNQQQWRHAKPYVQIAEDNMQRAQAAAEQCPAALPAPTPAVAETELCVPAVPEKVAAPAPVVSTPSAAKVLKSAMVAFEFDKFSNQDVRSYAELTSLLNALERQQKTIRQVTLIGHADRMAGRGAAYNQMLSERRADTIRAWLEQHGVQAELIRYSFSGDSKQIKACKGVTPRAALLECLLPNRRVEVQFEIAAD
jgi:outer membrane protein OmpA-like peptidoglycan-associated protein